MKKILFVLFLCTAPISVQAQYIYKNTALGIRADFPCQPVEETEAADEDESWEEEYVIICEQEKSRSAFALFIAKIPGFEASKAKMEEYLLAGKEKIADGFSGTPAEGFIMETTENSGELRFRMRSKELSGNFLLQCRNGYLIEIMYITEEKIDEAAWKRFSESFQADW